jgi:uncharacterized iron-regulated membrane protein
MQRSAILAFATAAALTLSGCWGKQDEPPPQAQAVPPAAPPAAAPLAAVEDKPASAPAPDADRSLAAKVKRALDAAPKLSAQGIEITVRRGIVSLFGAVDTAADKARMEQVAAGVEGVQSVDSQLRVVAGS